MDQKIAARFHPRTAAKISKLKTHHKDRQHQTEPEKIAAQTSSKDSNTIRTAVASYRLLTSSAVRPQNPIAAQKPSPSSPDFRRDNRR